MIRRALFSTWTAVPGWKPELGPLLVATYAQALARRHFPEVHFVTDEKGRGIAALLGWRFTNVSTALENLNAPPEVWTAGKMEALRIQDAPALHIDQDALLLMDELPAEFLTAPLCAQSPDRLPMYQAPQFAAIFEHAALVRGFTPYNAGLIGGADLQHVRRFAANSLATMRTFAGTPHRGNIATAYCEQYYLGQYAGENGLPVGTLFPTWPTPEQTAALPFCHLIGGSKRNAFYLRKIARRLSREFPEDFRRFTSGWKALVQTSGLTVRHRCPACV